VHAAIFFRFLNHVEKIPPVTRSPWSVIVDVLLLRKDFVRLLFLHAYREASALAGELPEESDKFRFLRAACLAKLKGSVGLIFTKASAMRATIPIDVSTRPFIPLPRFFHSRRTPPPLFVQILKYSYLLM
jgi:hypothetical protein